MLEILYILINSESYEFKSGYFKEGELVFFGGERLLNKDKNKMQKISSAFIQKNSIFLHNIVSGNQKKNKTKCTPVY